MTAIIENVGQLDELPIGTIIATTLRRGETEYPFAVASKTPSGLWKTNLGNTHIGRGDEWAADARLWIGADVMVRKRDYLAMAQLVDDCKAEMVGTPTLTVKPSTEARELAAGSMRSLLPIEVTA